MQQGQKPISQLKGFVQNVRTNIVQRNASAGSGFQETRVENASTEQIKNICITFETLINSVFSSKSQRDCITNIPLNVCNAKELPCFFEFLQTCTPRRDEDLVYGTNCLRHLNVTNRTFTAIGTQTTVDMQPIFTKPATCEPNIFLWSFLTNVSYAKAKDLISFMNISTAESNQLAKFIMAVSEPYGKRQNSEEYQRLNQYLSAYCQHAIRCLDGIPDRDKILVPIHFTTSFGAENMENAVVESILTKADNKLYSHQIINENTIQVFVPLTALNLLDQINLLSFRINCGVGRVSLAPNVSITTDRVYVGTGLSIQNAISTVKIGKMRSNQPELIYRLITNVHGSEVHNNYDTLVLLAVPDNLQNSIHPPIFIAKRMFLSQTFDIEKLDTQFC